MGGNCALGRYQVTFCSKIRASTETGNPGNESGHGKVMDHEKIGQKSWTFVISHGILPIWP